MGPPPGCGSNAPSGRRPGGCRPRAVRGTGRGRRGGGHIGRRVRWRPRTRLEVCVSSRSADEGLVDLDEDRPLAVAQSRVRRDRQPHRAGLLEAGCSGVEDACADVQGLGRHLQPASELLQDLCARPLEAALDLRQVRVRDPGEVGQLAQRQLGGLTLLAQLVAEVVPQKLAHATIMLALVSKTQTLVSVEPVTVGAAGLRRARFAPLAVCRAHDPGPASGARMTPRRQCPYDAQASVPM